jgi:hypothetical protein
MIPIVNAYFYDATLCCRWKDKDDLISSNTFIQDFKTSDTYGYQPIVCSKLSREIVRYFIGI